jgi:hypothetical protein
VVQSVFHTGQQRQDQSLPLSVTEVVAGLWRPTDTERGDGAIDSEGPFCEGDFDCVPVQVIDSIVKEGWFDLVCVRCHCHKLGVRRTSGAVGKEQAVTGSLHRIYIGRGGRFFSVLLVFG